jgi:hypothetical protein
MDESNKDLITKIKKEIEKCGFPLEIFIIEECSKKNTGRMPNYRYTYKDKIREIDLNAHFSDVIIDGPNNIQSTSTTLIIECKKSLEHPWVFFSLKMYEQNDVLYFLKYISTFDLDLQVNSHKYLLPSISSSLKNHHYASKDIPKCVSYFEAFSNIHGESNIYTAIDSVQSFLNYELELWGKIIANQNKKDCLTNFFYPIIVLQGKLFEAQIREGKTELISRNHLQLRVTHSHNTVIIDVVTKEYFPQFFEMLEKDHKECIQAIGNLNLDEQFKIDVREHYKNKFPKHKFSQ